MTRHTSGQNRNRASALLTGLPFQVAVVVVFGVIIYSNSFDCSFHFDDIANITENPVIRDIGDPGAVWNYINRRFVGFYTFALNYHFNGLNVFGYHLVNLLIHIAASLSVLWFVRLLLLTPVMKNRPIAEAKDSFALACAILFVSHPLQTQAVTYIVQRLSSLAALFYLLTLCLYLKARLSHVKAVRIVIYAAAFLTAALGLFTKENTFTLPLAVLSIEIFFFRPFEHGITGLVKKKGFWLAAIPSILFLVTIPYLLSFQLHRILGAMPSQRSFDPPLSSGIYLMTQFRVLVTYLRLFVVPINQNLDYDYPASLHLLEPSTLAGLVFLIAFAVVFLVFTTRRLEQFGVVWFFLTMSVESSIKPLGNVIFEHRMYLPMVGLILIIVRILYHIFGSSFRNAAFAIVLFIAVVNGGLTFARNRVWKNDLTLWTDVAKKSPNKPRAHVNLGIALEGAERSGEAAVRYRRALELNPRYDRAHTQLGNIHYRRGDYDSARKYYEQSIEYNKFSPETHFNLGNVYLQAGKLAEAKGLYERAIRLNPSYTKAYTNLGIALYNEGDFNGASEQFERAISIDPTFIDAHINLGNTLLANNDVQGGLREYETALRLDPANTSVMKSLALVYTQTGDIGRAIRYIEEALRIRNQFDARYHLGLLLKSQGKPDEAAAQFREALRLKPDLAEAEEQLREIGEAVK